MSHKKYVDTHEPARERRGKNVIHHYAEHRDGTKAIDGGSKTSDYCLLLM
jgi:hypothetical protein